MRMVRVLVAALAASTIAGGAFAADLPSRKAPPVAYIAPAPMFTWTGLYVGINGGGWFNNSSINYGWGSGKLGGGGGLVGGTIGYNWQAGSNVVVGVESDLDYRTKSNVTPTNLVATSVGSGFLGTTRARIGLSMDRALIYATGGLAYGTPVAPAAINSLVPAFFGSQSSSAGTAIGWAAGGGVEFAVTNNWSIKGEYLYASLGSKSVTYNTTILPVAVADKTGEHTARVGVNYHFNMGAPGGYVKY